MCTHKIKFLSFSCYINAEHILSIELAQLAQVLEKKIGK